MSVDHIISRICNSRIGEVILIGDSTTLLDIDTISWEVYMQWIVGHEPEHLVSHYNLHMVPKCS